MRDLLPWSEATRAGKVAIAAEQARLQAEQDNARKAQERSAFVRSLTSEPIVIPESNGEVLPLSEEMQRWVWETRSALADSIDARDYRVDEEAFRLLPPAEKARAIAAESMRLKERVRRETRVMIKGNSVYAVRGNPDGVIINPRTGGFKFTSYKPEIHRPEVVREGGKLVVRDKVVSYPRRDGSAMISRVDIISGKYEVNGVTFEPKMVRILGADERGVVSSRTKPIDTKNTSDTVGQAVRGAVRVRFASGGGFIDSRTGRQIATVYLGQPNNGDSRYIADSITYIHDTSDLPLPAGNEPWVVAGAGVDLIGPQGIDIEGLTLPPRNKEAEGVVLSREQASDQLVAAVSTGDLRRENLLAIVDQVPEADRSELRSFVDRVSPELPSPEKLFVDIAGEIKAAKGNLLLVAAALERARGVLSPDKIDILAAMIPQATASVESGVPPADVAGLLRDLQAFLAAQRAGEPVGAGAVGASR